MVRQFLTSCTEWFLSYLIYFSEQKTVGSLEEKSQGNKMGAEELSILSSQVFVVSIERKVV